MTKGNITIIFFYI